MSDRTGLDPEVVALLDALDLLGAAADAEPVGCSDVLLAAERLHGAAPAAAWPLLVARGVPWLVHLPLVELVGNAGSQAGDPPAPPEHVGARLSELGALALAAERGEVGPLPIGLVEGTLHRGGEVPPFDPASVVGALLAGGSDAGPPSLPAGGTVEGEVDALLRGERARLVLGCTIVDEIDRLVITEVPLGVTTTDVVDAVGARLRGYEQWEGGVPRLVRRHEAGASVHDIRDESSGRFGLRLVIDIERRTNVPRVVEWLRTITPVTVEVDCRLPAPMPELLRGWDRGDGTGLRALADALLPRF
jgi:hypothetical protein